MGETVSEVCRAALLRAKRYASQVVAGVISPYDGAHNIASELGDCYPYPGARHGAGGSAWRSCGVFRRISGTLSRSNEDEGVPAHFAIGPDDEMPGASPAVARTAYERLAGPKELLEIEGGHFGLLYHPGAVFDRVSRAQRDFLVRHLAML